MPIHLTHPTTHDTLTAHLIGAALVISPRYGESYSFDRSGRLLGLFRDERSYQRTLDHRLLERLTGNGPRRRELPPEERDAMLARVFADLRALRDDLPAFDLKPEDRALLDGALDKILDFGPDRLAADGARFRSLYLPVSILPPDQYLALVLQATEGCSWNRCTFCGLYRDRAFRIHSPESFRAHCAGVRPVYSFVSAFDVARKSAAEWADLHALGLTRATIGLETGDDDLLRFLNKPGTVQDALEAVAALRAGGVAVGVILMAGIGGDRFAAAHVARSVEAIRAMNLGPADQVYLSNYVSAPGTEYNDLAASAGIRSLSADEIETQLKDLQARVRAVVTETKVAPYRVDGFAL
jgi:radical SAM superfamily enzyme YgiQ (UPF0313 family)